MDGEHIWRDLETVVLPQVARIELDHHGHLHMVVAVPHNAEGLKLLADVFEWAAAECRKALEREESGHVQVV